MTKSRLRRTLSSWANSDNQDARDLRHRYTDSGCECIAESPDRQRVKLRGTLKTVTLRPRGGAPVLEAELYDGSGVVTLVWLGRRRIAGVDPGRSMEVVGRIGAQDGQRVIFNPRYELIP